jgi:hypothetical protein
MSVKYKTLVVNYPIASGNIEFPSMLISGSNNMCTVNIEGLESSDASVELHQSIDDESWGLVPDSFKILSAGQASHTWNIRGLVKESFLRVSFQNGNASSGTITNIKLLSDA